MRSFALLLGLAAARCASGQDGASPFRLVAGIDLGVGLPRLETINGAAFTTSPHFAGTVDVGATWTYRERWGLAALGVFAINGYDYTNGAVDYDIYHLTRRAEVRAFWQRSLNERLRTSVRAGIGLGLAFQGGDTRDTREGTFQALTTANPLQRTYLAPEVCLVKMEGRHRVEWGLRYVAHLQREVALSTRLSDGADTTLATARHDHLALVIRFHLGLKRRVPPAPPPPAIAYGDRTTDTLTTLTANRQRITLWLWDNAERDGDTLSVIVNGRPVLSGLALTRKRHKLKVDLAPGMNELLVVAHNEGRVPPNTASAVVRTGRGRKELLFSTSLQRNQALRIVREAR
ncbi:MAG: hypothetical protein JNL05_00050 [Flavobacteriales bacterium]|nr:hypothetical protein [Flavobacteriales bacterium]